MERNENHEIKLYTQQPRSRYENFSPLGSILDFYKNIRENILVYINFFSL